MDEKTMKQKRRTAIILLLITLIGGVLYFKFIDLLTMMLRSQLQINENGNDFTKSWQDVSIPIDFDVYVFSIQNPQEFVRGTKAKLKEYGPYTYNLKIQKDIVSFSDDQRIVKFYDIHSFYFKNNESKNKLHDQVQVLNFPVYALANKAHSLISSLPFSYGLNPIVFSLLSIFFLGHRESMIKTLTVGELLNGYPFRVLDTIDRLVAPLGLFGIKIPDTGMPDNKFGFLWTKNFTRMGPYQAFTGKDGTDLLQIVSYKDQNSLDIYDDPACNDLKGTEGNSFGIDITRDKKYVFTHDLCRSIDLIYLKDTWVNGLRTYRFVPNPLIFSAPSKNPLNRCYCTTPDNEDLCDGIFDLTPCTKVPLAYSFPHFLLANPIIRNNVVNMQPSNEKHYAYVDIEPFTGSPLNGVDKIQINALVDAIPYLSGFNNVRHTILPLLWFEKRATIDDKLTKQLQILLYLIYTIYAFIYLLFFGGLFLLLIHMGRWGYNWLKNTKTISHGNTTNPKPNLMESLFQQMNHNNTTNTNTDFNVQRNEDIRSLERY